MTTTASPRFKSCFISAPFGTDTSVIRAVLARRQIRWFDQTSVEAGEALTDFVDSAISDSDFVCAVISERDPATLFELGMAYAKRKPLLVFGDSPLKLSLHLGLLTHVRVDPRNQQEVARAIDTFLAHARPRPRARKGSRRRKKSGRVQAKQFDLALAEVVKLSPGSELELRTAALFQKAGFVVSGLNVGADPAADFAVWSDELGDILGSPILVEVKGWSGGQQQLGRWIHQLRTWVEKTHSGSGILVHWGTEADEFEGVSAGLPLVLCLDGQQLERLVLEDRLFQELTRRRNRAVHGGM